MNGLMRLAATVTPGEDNLDPTLVSPGLAGAVTMFLLAVATIVLIRSMVAHLRKVQYSPDPNAAPPTGPDDGPRRPTGS